MSAYSQRTHAYWRGPPSRRPGAGRLAPRPIVAAALLAGALLCFVPAAFSQEVCTGPDKATPDGQLSAFERPEKEEVDAAVGQLLLLLAIVIIGGILFLVGYWYYYVPPTETSIPKQEKTPGKPAQGRPPRSRPKPPKAELPPNELSDW